MNSLQATAPPAVQEYSIRVPKQGKKKHHVMRFNSVLNIDFTKWSQVKLERENNQKEFKGPEDDQPKYGAGSEFGRDAKEEARRKKFGIVSRRYRPEDQPWILKSGGKTGKKFKGIREGGVGENAAYYVFTHAADGAIEAFPLCEWYNFQPIQRYKPLSAEEAEQEFGRRNKVMNYFSLMLRKRLKGEDDADLDDGEEGKGKKGGKRKSKELKISDMEDWMVSGDDDSSSGEEKTEQQKEEKTQTKKKDLANKKKERKKKKGGSDDSAIEESDDGDEEGRELDYISDSSDSESDVEAKAVKEMKGVSEESALRRLLTSDEDEDDEEKKEEKKKSDSEEQPEKVEGKAEKDKSSTQKKKKKKKPKNKSLSEKKADAPPPKVDKNDDSSSNFSPDSSDSEAEGKAKLNSAGSSRCGSPTAGPSDSEKKSQRPPSKRPRLDPVSSPLLLGDSGITEEAVRRYLMRKPMTTTELLQKFKSRKTGLNSEQLVNVMTQILKRINPVKQTIKNKMYLSIKA